MLKYLFKTRTIKILLKLLLFKFKYTKKINFESRDKMDDAITEIKIIESIVKDPACYINQHFDKNKRHINWRRNDFVADINKYSDQLIDENESRRSQCLQLSATTTNNIARKINFLKEELFKLKKRLDEFDVNVAQLRCGGTEGVATFLKDRLSKTLKDYQESLFLNNELSFGYFKLPIVDIVGKMFDKKQVN